MAVTEGVFEDPARCTVEDLDWNHMDLDHRPWIHNTYHEASRVVIGPNIHSSVTKRRILGIPVFIQVTDIRLEPTLFYQCFTFFSLLHVHLVMRSLPGKMQAKWYIVSHRIFKFLHKPLERRILQLETVQNKEDEALRDRRADLRAKGYGFDRDPLDYITANQKKDWVSFPKLNGTRSIPLQGLPQGIRTLVKANDVEFLVQPEPGAKNSYSVWLGVCPHEGASLNEGKICGAGNEIQCPWHGLKLSCIKVDAVNSRATLGTFEVALSPSFNELLVSDVK